MKKQASILFFLALFLTSCFETNTVYVSVNGKDENNGSKNRPFLKIERARDHIKTKRSKGKSGHYTIALRGGDYYIKRTIHFDEKDSSILIRPYNNESVSLKGSIPVDPADITPVVGTEKEKLFRKETRDDIVMIPLKDLKITDYGILQPVGFGRPTESLWMELFVNGIPGQLSRWPNDSSIRIGKVIDKGSIANEDSNRGAVFKYEVDRPSGWSKPENIWIAGFFHHGWADDAIKLASIDTLQGTFTTFHPHRYSFGSDKPWNQWYAYNIVEEIDMPGEYYIDRGEGILYFYTPGTIETLDLSLLENPFMMIRGSSNITIEGIVFENTRGSAVELYGSRECILDSCTFRNLGSYAVNIDEGTRHSDSDQSFFSSGNGIVNCTIYNTGQGGIILSGGNRYTLESAHNFISNCTLYTFNRIAKTYSPGIKISGVGNRISHNEIFNAPHAAILLTGNDHLIEYNEIHHVCLETDDVGAVYYGRNPSERGNVVQYNFIHHLGEVYRTTAVYHDDAACGMNVHGNIFYKAGTIPTLIGGGTDNVYTNNIFIDCPVGIKVDNRLQAFEWAKPMIAPGGVIEERLNEIEYNQPPYSTRYPELARYWDEDLSFPKRNLIDKNLFVNVDKIILKVDEGVNADKEFLDFTDNNWITNEDPGFVDKANEDFRLRSTSAIFEKISGFESIPFEKIGTIKE